MTELTDERIKEIAKGVARESRFDLQDVKTSRTVDSAGVSTIEVKLVLAPGTTSAVPALTTSRLIQKMADAGEERFPIVRYDEGPSATSRS
jgi:hypothetical protein